MTQAGVAHHASKGWEPQLRHCLGGRLDGNRTGDTTILTAKATRVDARVKHIDPTASVISRRQRDVNRSPDPVL